MKKWMVYILLSSFIFTNADLIQIFRIPNLWEHFYEHNKASKDLTFSEFLKDHYFNLNHSDHDTAKDNALPFKTSVSPVLLMFGLDIPPKITKIKLPFLIQTTSSKVCNNLANLYYFSYLSHNWNPPKGLL